MRRRVDSDLAALCATFLFRMPTIRIPSSRGAYRVYCSRGALARADSVLEELGDSTGTFVLSSPNVWTTLGTGRWRSGLAELRANRTFLFDDSESAKNLATVELLCRALSGAGADRRAVIVAVGGGVVGDVAGFTAASYLRGVRLVQIPTTLVAQVDSSVGGKTGVNLPEGKNLVGAFYPPKAVIADLETLATLAASRIPIGLVRNNQVWRDRRCGAFRVSRAAYAGAAAARSRRRWRG